LRHRKKWKGEILRKNIKIYSENVFGQNRIGTLHARVRRKNLLEKALKQYYKEGALLEIGCGSGEILTFISKKYDQLVGLDLSLTMVKDASKLVKTPVILADAEFLPFKNENFSIIYFFELIEHLPSPYNFLLEVNRILAANGLIIFTTPNPFTYPFLKILSSVHILVKFGKDLPLSMSSIKKLLIITKFRLLRFKPTFFLLPPTKFFEKLGKFFENSFIGRVTPIHVYVAKKVKTQKE